MRPGEFGEALAPQTRLTLFSNDKPDHLFRVIKFWLDETAGIARALKTGVPSYQVEDEEGRIHLLIHVQLKTVNIAGASSGQIKQVLVPGLFLMARWLRNRKVYPLE